MKTAIDLFCGGGGASIGLKKAGFEVVAGFEIDPDIAEVYQINHPKAKVIIEDIRSINFHQFSGIDHLHGSPPCQCFSMANPPKSRIKRKEEENLILEWVRAIAEARPKSASLENVTPIRKMPIFAEACNRLFALGFWLNWQVYDAADFGIPQIRKRLFLFAIRNDAIADFSLDGVKQNLFGEKYFWKNFQKTDQIGWHHAIIDLIGELPEIKPAKWQLAKLSEELKNFLSNPGSEAFLVPRVGASSGAFLKGRPKEKPAYTIRALGHQGHWRQLDIWLPGSFKQASPRALARFQSFPDDFWLPPKPWLAGKIIGNAVPPKMLEILLKNIS